MSIANTLLTPTGLELRSRTRTIPELQNEPQTASAGRIIEFVGTQGIGKSTLSNDLQGRLKDRWYFRSHLAQLGPSPSAARDMEKVHRDLYFRRIQWLQERDSDPWHSITQSRQMGRVISESLTLMTNEFPRGFILDEGLFKNFPREILDIAETAPDALWTRRALVHLRARDTASVLDRYVNRVAERGRRGLLQRAPSEAELLQRVEQDTIRFDRMLEIAQARGCPTLVIHAEDPHDENIARILEFERSRFAMSDAPS